MPIARTIIEITEGIRVCCPDDMALLTPYVLHEQNDWFEDEMPFFRRLVTPQSVFIDIGANYGLYSLSAARRGALAVWSYEPCAETASCLRESIAANAFTQVRMLQKAASDRSGAGRLLNEENSELNALLAPDDERGEEVVLTSLDEEAARHGWREVDLVKIDAEGHELQVLTGGERFFIENSPLVMCEIKAGSRIDLGPVRRFLELGYDCYRLAPGLQALVSMPLDERIDTYQLNVFCCKPDRAATLAARGLLALKSETPAVPAQDAWLGFLESFPYGARQAAMWRRCMREQPLADWSTYRHALDLYALAMSAGADIAQRAAALRESFCALDALVKRQANLPRLLSLARAAMDHGEREIAVKALTLILQSGASRASELENGEPFLAPSRDLEHADPGASVSRWAIASALDVYERLRGYSSYFSRADLTVSIAGDLRGMGFCTPRMERRAAAAVQRVRALAPAPGTAEAALHQARTHLQAGRLPEANTACQQALRITPGYPDALHLWGTLCYRNGQYQQAYELIGRAIRAHPGEAAWHSDFGLACQALGRGEEGIAAWRRAIELQPTFVQALMNLGGAMLRQGAAEEAADCFGKAARAQPALAAAHYNLGSALLALGRLEEAGASFDAAVACAPDHADATLSRGLVHARAGNSAAAVPFYRRALELRPGWAQAQINLGHALQYSDRIEEAIACYRQALAAEPGNMLAHYAHLNLAVLLQRIGAHEEATRHYAEAQRLGPDSTAVQSTVLMSQLYTGSEPEVLLSSHRAWAQRFEAPLRAGWPRHVNTREPARRLKIGYVSPDLCCHSVAYFLEPVLANHDRAAVEVYCYHTGLRTDDVSARLAALSDHWLACSEWNDESLAQRIMADGIDVLVDLAGHTLDGRLGVFARKPAPVQAGWLGYPATTGLDAMDWRICTAATDPPGEERWHSERLYRLPRSLWCYRPEPGNAVHEGAPMLRRGGEVHFGSMNNLTKVSAESIAAWAAVLDAVPGSRLVMTVVPEGEARRLLAERFAAHGIGAERLLLNGRLGGKAFADLLDSIDIALDPFPYNGTTTTCETLWHGVPVVSLEGKRSVARSGHALLGLLGLDWLVAKDEASYVALAASLARDPERLSALRAELRSRFELSALRDEVGFTRDLEHAYRDMWRTWCETKGV